MHHRWFAWSGATVSAAWVVQPRIRKVGHYLRLGRTTRDILRTKENPAHWYHVPAVPIGDELKPGGYACADERLVEDWARSRYDHLLTTAAT